MNDIYTLLAEPGSDKLYVTATTFQATAKDLLTVNRVDFSAVQTVALDATTLVIRDTQFKDGSAVSLGSQKGLLAGSPGTGANIQRGMVNIVSGVKYGTTEVKLQNATAAMNNAAFHIEAVKPTSAGGLGNALGNITILPAK